MARWGIGDSHEAHSAGSPSPSRDTLSPQSNLRGLKRAFGATDETSEGLMEEHAGNKRTVIWALVVGGLGGVVAIVALIIAISANSTTDDTAKITKAVRVEEARQIGGVRADLQKNVAAAIAVL